ncbi:hypothetical protein [Mitsuokella jalaludinii]|uniref:hypothetical protein n=1 Tax=Mitsuokella jalaludinii TaxID=187979 RepID=UPI003F9E87F7
MKKLILSQPFLYKSQKSGSQMRKMDTFQAGKMHHTFCQALLHLFMKRQPSTP